MCGIEGEKLGSCKWSRGVGVSEYWTAGGRSDSARKIPEMSLYAYLCSS